MGMSFEHGLRVRELAETPFAVVRAHARMTGTVEWNTLHHHMYTHFVDATAAKLLGLHHAIRPAHIAREEVHR